MATLSILAIATTLLFVFVSPTTAQTCYNPDRTTSPNSVPCTSSSSPSNSTFCCDRDSICLSSGYCLRTTTQPYGLYRGACTDSGWGDFCAYYCVNYLTASTAPITNIGSNEQGRAIYCCGSTPSNSNSSRAECADGDAPFVLEDGEMVVGVAALATIGNRTSDGIESGSGSAAGDEGDGDAGAAQCSNNDVAIGAGVGVPLGVIAIAAMAWALLERRKRNVMRPGPVDNTIGSEKGSGEQTPAPAGAEKNAKQVYIPPQKLSGPTELDQLENPRSMIHGTGVVEMMGSEGDNSLGR